MGLTFGIVARRLPARLARRVAVCSSVPLLVHLAARTSRRTLHRLANLKDMFRKLTGRELRD